jgi:Tannase and feruloyl esterase
MKVIVNHAAARGGIALHTALLSAAFVASCAGAALAQTAASSPQEACTKLAGTFIPPGAIGLPTSGAVVQSARLVAVDAADNPNCEYCAVRGVVVPVSAAAPNMEFEVNLPTNWNNKALQLGGGGFDGVLVTGLGPAGLQPARPAEQSLQRGRPQRCRCGGGIGHRQIRPQRLAQGERVAFHLHRPQGACRAPQIGTIATNQLGGPFIIAPPISHVSQRNVRACAPLMSGTKRRTRRSDSRVRRRRARCGSLVSMLRCSGPC